MQLSSKPFYLALHDSDDRKGRKIELSNSFEDVLGKWTSGSRMSPVWRLSDENTESQTETLFKDSLVVFLGPVRIAKIRSEIPEISDAHSCWATFGCFNVVIEMNNDAVGQELSQKIQIWAKNSKVAFEKWVLSSGEIEQVEQHVLNERTVSLTKELLQYEVNHEHPSVRTSYQESVVTTATSLSRAAAVYPPIYDELERASQSIRVMMECFANGQLTLLEMQSRLLTMNAAMSRFSSQAFSGIPPICGTECHFWIHSLLGTGSANIALASMVASIQHVLGEARLFERIEALADITEQIPSQSEMISNPDLLKFDIIDEVNLKSADPGDIIPLITYFSGRDGFSSHLQTLSAPLTTLAECNSMRSNLLTVTHEISHIFIQSTLAILSPTPNVVAEFKKALEMLESDYQPGTMLEAAKVHFLNAVVSIATEARPNGEVFGDLELKSQLPEIIETTRREVQEILVHTFDFLYFHAGEPEYYIVNIWHSWCAIPGIADRIPEYLIRTLCAVSSGLLEQKPEIRFQAALKDTKRVLEKIEQDIGLDNNYVSAALEYLKKMDEDEATNERMRNQFFVRTRLVQLVRIFLHSEKLGAKLFDDAHRGGGAGYKTKRPLHYDASPVGNALQFLRTNLKTNTNEAESLWVLHALAFDHVPSPLTS